MRILIYGAGNLLLSDEGFGVHFVRYLGEHYTFPDEVELLDAGTLGLMVTHKLEEADRVYIVDVITSSGPPGTTRRFAKSEFMAKNLPIKLSPHQSGVQEMLLLSELRGRAPDDVYLLGVIPASLEPGTDPSPTLRCCLERLGEELITELQGLGISINRKRR